jgi:hypothetical protein
VQRTAALGPSEPPFLTRPYWSPHYVTSIFDHCNPDYTQDGQVCEFDGTVASRSNGVDPNFAYGYAITPGGTDYLYYDGHNGWDLALNYEPVLAAAGGTVNLAGSDPYNPGFGETITIDHGNGFTTRYAHLSQIWVSPGQAVSRGQQIGVSGNTGNSTGPHLHFGVYITSSWTAIDPWGWTGSGTDEWPYDSGNLWFTGNPHDPIPDAPGTPTAVARDSAAVVNWSAPGFDGGSGISSYTVTASPGGQTVTVGGGTLTATVTGLTNGTTYTFTVTAANGIGSGPASAASNPVVPGAVWSAAYDLSPSPTVWFKGQSQDASVTVTNTGTTTWPSGGTDPVHLGVHFSSASGCPAYSTWLNDVRVNLPNDVAPGNSVTLSFSAPAPSMSQATLVYQMVKENEFWFNQCGSGPVTMLNGVYTADAFGGLHPAGGSPPLSGGPSWPGWNISRASHALPGASGPGSGLELDGWGGLHPFGTAAVNVSGSAYWPNWDIARDFAFLPDGSGGYVLDGWGGLHPFAVNGGALPPPVQGAAYWPNWDIARQVVIFSDGSGGLVLDGWGGLHPFGIGRAPSVQGMQAAYWPNWDIARGLVLLPGSQSGYTLDGWGGLHPFAPVGQAAPAAVTAAYWPNWDIARGVWLLPGASGQQPSGYTLDGWGGLHPFAGVGQTLPGPLAAGGYSPNQDIARAVWGG